MAEPTNESATTGLSFGIAQCAGWLEGIYRYQGLAKREDQTAPQTAGLCYWIDGKEQVPSDEHLVYLQFLVGRCSQPMVGRALALVGDGIAQHFTRECADLGRQINAQIVKMRGTTGDHRWNEWFALQRPVTELAMSVGQRIGDLRAADKAKGGGPAPDMLISATDAARRWERSASWWRSQVGEGKPIAARGTRGRAKLFSIGDAEAVAARYGLQRNKPDR